MFQGNPDGSCNILHASPVPFLQIAEHSFGACWRQVRQFVEGLGREMLLPACKLPVSAVGMIQHWGSVDVREVINAPHKALPMYVSA